jgi:hypothetical protein
MPRRPETEKMGAGIGLYYNHQYIQVNHPNLFPVHLLARPINSGIICD